MRRINIYIIFIVLVIFAGIFSYLYVFNIYEVTYAVKPQSLPADSKSIVTISSKPINAFGWKAPFRKAAAKFDIKGGNDLIDILSEDSSRGILKIKSKNKPGKIVLYIKSKYALLPSAIEINIYPI